MAYEPTVMDWYVVDEIKVIREFLFGEPNNILAASRDGSKRINGGISLCIFSLGRPIYIFFFLQAIIFIFILLFFFFRFGGGPGLLPVPLSLRPWQPEC